MIDYDKIILLPQISGICWFLSVLTILLYSENLREIIKKELEKKTKKEIKDNKFLKTLLFIVDNNYTNPEKIRNLLKDRFTLEFLLFKYIEIYKKDILKHQLKSKLKKNITSLGNYYFYFIIDLFKELKINFQDLYFYDNYLYKSVLSDKPDVYSNDFDENDKDKLKVIFDEPPEILLLYHQDLFEDFNKYQIYTDIYEDKKYSLKEATSKLKERVSEESGIPGYKKEITYNGIKYKLESCLLSNIYKDDTVGSHVISGITYNNDNYIYNSWNINNKKEKNACSLFKKDWKSDMYSRESDFCISKKECKLYESIPSDKLCFNFGYNKKAIKLLIYVRDKEEINSSSLLYSSKSLKEYLSNYYQLNKKTIEELKLNLKEIGYSSVTINKITIENIRVYLEDKYKSKFKVKYEADDETVLKKFIIKLLKSFIKDNYIYNYIELFKLDPHNYQLYLSELTPELIKSLNKDTLIKLYLFLYKKTEINKDLTESFYIFMINKLLLPIEDSYSKIKLLSKESEGGGKYHCSNLEVIPQILGNCWFNAILMCLLYSEETRKITYSLSMEWSKEEIKKDKLKNFFTYILKYNYNKPEMITKLFEKRFKTEFLLLSHMYNNKIDDILKVIKQNSDTNITSLGYYNKYIITLLSLFNYKYIDLYYSDDNIYGNIMNNKLRIDETVEPPEIVVVFHEKLFNIKQSFSEYQLQTSKLTLSREEYEKIIIGVDEYKEVITINDINYELDSCLISNYNDINDIGHAIVGISCNNEGYVYNGWNIGNPISIYKNNYSKNIKKSCKLFKYDWKKYLYLSNDGFCLGKYQCNLTDIDEKDLCFNFSKGERILIYVKKDNSFKSPSFKSSSSSKSKSFKSKSLSPLIRKFYELEDKPIDKLKEILIQIGYNKELVKSITVGLIKNRFKIIYIYLFKKKLDDNDIPHELLKKFLIGLIKKYLIDDIIYDLSKLVSISNKYELLYYLLDIDNEILMNIYLVLNNNSNEMVVKEIPKNFYTARFSDLSEEKKLLLFNIINIYK